MHSADALDTGGRTRRILPIPLCVHCACYDMHWSLLQYLCQ